MKICKSLSMILVVCFILAGLTACSDGDGSVKALQGAGYTNIQITGYAFFGCGENDTYHTGFTAKGPTGVQVSGVVCSGVLKGSTIRTE